MSIESPIIVALDVPTGADAIALADRLDPRLCRVKIGKELFTVTGPGLLEQLHARGFEIFLDLKWHDIPNTVASACRVAADLGVWMLDVHASGGSAMMREAVEALAGAARRPIIVGVTVLTSLTDADLAELGIGGSAAEAALRLARLAAGSGLDGVVCSAREAALLRGGSPDGFVLVTPGIRPAGAALDDQQRVTTPADAVLAGADYLVVGRPVTRAADPAAALAGIAREAIAARARSRGP